MVEQDNNASVVRWPETVKRQLYFAFAQARFAVAMADTAGRIVYVNAAFREHIGYSRDEVVGQSFSLLKCDDHNDAFYQTIRERLAAGGFWSDKLTVRKKDGTRYHSRSIVAPVTDGGGRLLGYSVFSRDTAAESKLEAQLSQLQKMEAIGEMAAGIAHEINTPIQYVGDNIQFLKDAIDDVLRLVEALSRTCELGRTGSIPEEKLEEIAALHQEIDLDYLKEELPLAIEQALEGRNRVAAIVRAMKEFAHPGDEELTPVDVNHAIENTLAVSRGEWKHIADIEKDLKAALPHVPCFPGLFNQVLLNLVVNAAHAIAETRVTGQEEKGRITVATRREGDFVIVAITDTGCGIPQEHVHRIFEPFYTTKDVGKGTGQGLALAHAAIVEKMGGRIEVDSTPGKGTQFRLYLPLEDAVGNGE